MLNDHLLAFGGRMLLPLKFTPRHPPERFGSAPGNKYSLHYIPNETEKPAGLTQITNGGVPDAQTQMENNVFVRL